MIRLIQFFAVLLLPLTVAAEQPKPWLLLPWGGDGPTLRAGGPEVQAAGPAAIAVDGDSLIIADTAAKRILRVGPDGAVAAESVPAAALDLAVGPDGQLALLGEGLDRVHWRPADGQWAEEMLSPKERPRRIAWDHRGVLWLGLVDGSAVPLLEPVAPPGKRALPLAGSPAHAWATREASGTAVAWVWPWDHPARFKDSGAERIEISTPPGRGLVMPLARAGDDQFDVLVEWMSAGNDTVHAEVRRIDRAGKTIRSFAWPRDDIAPVYRPAAVALGGALYVMRAMPDGLAIFRVEAGKVEAP